MNHYIAAAVLLSGVACLTPADDAPPPTTPATETAPAYQLNVSSSFIARAGRSPIYNVSPISDRSGRTQTCGQTRIIGWQRIDVLPCPDRALFRVTIDADIDSDLLITRPLSKLHANSHSALRVTQDIVVSDCGVAAAPASISAPTCFRVWAVDPNPPGRGIVMRGAQRFGAVQRFQDRTATERTETETEKETRKRVDEEIAKANASFTNELLPGLADAGVRRDQIRLSTSAAGLYASVALPLPVPPGLTPPVDPNADARVSVHASLLNAYLQKKYAGHTFEGAEFSKPRTGAVADLLGPSAPATEKDVTIRLADKDPMTVAFRKSEVVFVIRGSEFTVDDDVFPAMNITIRWAVEKRGDAFVLVRKTPEVYPPGFVPGTGKTLPARMQSIRTVLIRRLDRELPKEIDPERITKLPGLAPSDRLRATQLVSSDDWLWLEVRVVQDARSPVKE